MEHSRRAGLCGHFATDPLVAPQGLGAIFVVLAALALPVTVIFAVACFYLASIA